jgi:hypothetical protein
MQKQNVESGISKKEADKFYNKFLVSMKKIKRSLYYWENDEEVFPRTSSPLARIFKKPKLKQ